jgi:methyl-accepting chemotaxis protein
LAQDIVEVEGDLTRRIAVQGRNEIDGVGIRLDVFIGRIGEIVRRVAEHASTDAIDSVFRDFPFVS